MQTINVPLTESDLQTIDSLITDGIDIAHDTVRIDRDPSDETLYWCAARKSRLEALRSYLNLFTQHIRTGQ